MICVTMEDHVPEQEAKTPERDMQNTSEHELSKGNHQQEKWKHRHAFDFSSVFLCPYLRVENKTHEREETHERYDRYG